MRFNKFHMLMNQAGGADGGSGGGGAGASGGQGGSAGAAGNSGGTGGSQGGGSGGKDGGTISREEFNRVMQDMHKFKDEARTLREQVENDKAAKLREQNDWKSLAEKYENELKSERENAKRLESSFMDEKKYSAVRQAAEKLGLRPEALSDLEMLDLGQITVETTSTGKINVLGAETFAERVKTLKPHWFSDKTPPSVNTSGTRVLDTGSTVTVRQVLDAEKEGKKSGDMSKYHQLSKQLQQQRMAQRGQR